MAADVVENVRLLKVIELVAVANEAGGRKTPPGEESEKDVVRNQPGNRDNSPSGGGVEHLVQPTEIRDAIRRNSEFTQPVAS